VALLIHFYRTLYQVKLTGPRLVKLYCHSKDKDTSQLLAAIDKDTNLYRLPDGPSLPSVINVLTVACTLGDVKEQQ
jgi:hypothetical protein